MKTYCPACGEWHGSDIDEISPSTIRLKCSECGTEFDIKIEYTELWE